MPARGVFISVIRIQSAGRSRKPHRDPLRYAWNSPARPRGHRRPESKGVMFDFSRFSLRNMVECGSALRRLGEGAGSMEHVAARVVCKVA